MKIVYLVEYSKDAWYDTWLDVETITICDSKEKEENAVLKARDYYDLPNNNYYQWIEIYKIEVNKIRL